MGIVQSIGKGFSLSTKLLVIALIFFIFNFVRRLMMLPFTGPTGATNPQLMPVTLLLSLISVLIFIFLQGGALGAIRDMIKNNSFSLSSFVANGKKYYLRILGLFAIILLLALALIIIIALISGGLLAVANNAFTRSLLTAIIIVISVCAVILLLFPIYSIILEDKGPIAAIKKGIQVSMQNFWKAMGLFLLLLLIAFVLAFLVGVVGALLAGALPLKVGQAVMLFVNSALQSYLSVVMMTAFMSFYLGLCSKENVSEGPTPA